VAAALSLAGAAAGALLPGRRRDPLPAHPLTEAA
jgi:hypothetical protein